jgi:hypothetical protein
VRQKCERALASEEKLVPRALWFARVRRDADQIPDAEPEDQTSTRDDDQVGRSQR